MEGASTISSMRPKSAYRHADRRHTQNAASSTNRRSMNGVRSSAAASPEVITSLISSLSAISTPAEDLFDSLLPSTSVHSAPPSPTNQSFGGNAQLGAHVGNGYLHPDEAAIAPVIKTSKPPSGYSPLTAPKKKQSPSGSPRWSQDRSTIGNLSIEPGERRSSATASLLSERSGKSRSQSSLRIKSSKEKMRGMDKERKKREKSKSPGRQAIDSGSTHSEGPKIGDFPSGFGDAINLAAPIVPPRSGSAQRSPSRSNKSNRSSFIEDGPGGIGGGRSIPTRDSSLRHSSPESSRARRKRRSYRASQVPAESNIVESNEELAFDKTPPVPKIEVQEEDSVTKRIKELKAQKEKREQTQSKSDDEGSRQRELHRQEKKKAGKGRASLPAPSAPSGARSVSDGQLLTSSSRPNGATDKIASPRPSYNSQRSTSGPMSPGAHQRTSSNPITPARKSSQMDDRPSTADSIDDAVTEYITAPRLSQKIYHPQTGRAISFSEVGDPDGSVVFCCVGMGTTRYLTAFYDELALTLRLRLITPDRPGIGQSEPHEDGTDTPLGWPDDIRSICQHLGISRFSILAHSAGAIYALATALRMPQHIRGRLHLLAPWIPPSQMVTIGIHQEPVPATTLPYSQRFLRSLPTPFLRAANSSFFAVTSTSITTSIQKSPRRSKRRSMGANDVENANPGKTPRNLKRNSLPLEPEQPGRAQQLGLHDGSDADDEMAPLPELDPEMVMLSEQERQSEYDSRLTQAIWEAATSNANPAVDLLVCLERRQEIGFRYVDINKSIVVHHGSRDSRVPVENIRWLSKMMRNCELRVLEGEGHGLMASAWVMGDVLGEISREWDDWNAVTRRGRK